MPLVNAAESEEDENVRAEFYRALGRIGTQDAVQALVRTAKPKGLLKGFGQGLPGIKSDGARLAATEGLGLAGGRMSLDALQELSKDRDKGVKEMARKGLAVLRARPDRGESTNTTMSISLAGAQKLQDPSS